MRECRALGEVYEAGLDGLLAALHEEGDIGEAARIENLKTQLHREVGLTPVAPRRALRMTAQFVGRRGMVAAQNDGDVMLVGLGASAGGAEALKL